MLTTTLTGMVTERDALAITNAGPFTIPQGISAGTLVGDFDVSGGISGEYLDGILTGTGSDMFSVDDDDMTLMYKGGSLSVGTYSLSLTVSGDAGLANRTAIVSVMINVTASNMAPTVPATFAATIKENNTASGVLVDAGTAVGDASAGVSANDGDTLAYSLSGGDSAMYSIDGSSGMISVGSADIAEAADGSDVTHNFMITVSDGVTANDRNISASVTLDANAPAAIVGDAAITIAREVNPGDVPQVLANLQDPDERR